MAFIKEIPDELLNDILSCFGLISISDTHQICGNISEIVKVEAGFARDRSRLWIE